MNFPGTRMRQGIYDQWVQKLVEDAQSYLVKRMDEKIGELRQQMNRLPSQYRYRDLERRVAQGWMMLMEVRDKVTLMERASHRMTATEIAGLPKHMYRYRPKMNPPKSEFADPECLYEAVPICPLCKKDVT